MSKILFVNACARDESRTLELARHLLGKLKGEVSELKLYELSLSPLDREGLEKREKCARSGDFSHEEFRLARQLSEADTVVVAAPYWDLLFPAVLRTYFEAVSVSGITFAYSPKGIPVGLCKARTLYYVTTAGGYMGEDCFGFSYTKALSQKLYGIENVQLVAAEGLDIVTNDVQSIMNEAKRKVDEGFED